MMPPHVAQFVLREASGKIGRRIAPWAALESQYVQSRLAQFLPHDGSGPTEAHQHRIDRLESCCHRSSLRPTGSALETDRGVGHRFAVTGDPLLIVVMSPRESDHLPGRHIPVAAVD